MSPTILRGKPTHFLGSTIDAFLLFATPRLRYWKSASIEDRRCAFGETIFQRRSSSVSTSANGRRVSRTLHGVHFVKGDQSDPKALDQAIAATGGAQFDVIIDDASHLGLATKASFSYLFPRALKPDGLYVIEDFGAPLLRRWPDGAPLVRDGDGSLLSYRHGVVGFLKQLIDDLAIATPAYEAAFPIGKIEFHRNIAMITKGD